MVGQWILQVFLHLLMFACFYPIFHVCYQRGGVWKVDDPYRKCFTVYSWWWSLRIMTAANLRKISTGQIMYTKIKINTFIHIFLLLFTLIWFETNYFSPLMNAWGSHKTTHTRLIWSECTELPRYNQMSELLQSLWYLRLFFLKEHNHCEMWMRELTLRSEVCQNHSAAYDIERRCHLWQPGFHYSVHIYLSILRKSAFIRHFYR